MDMFVCRKVIIFNNRLQLTKIFVKGSSSMLIQETARELFKSHRWIFN